MNFNDLTKVVINLPSRPERRKQFMNELVIIKAHGNIFFSDGVIDSRPSVGIAKAHYNAIEFGLRNSDHALIMEDDIEFPGRAKTIPFIDQCLANLPEDWDILLGGVYNKNNPTKFNEYWDKVESFRALHFYIINKRGFEKMKAFKFDDHIDKWISENAFQCFVMNPFVAIQRDGFSDNVGHVTKYNTTLLKKFVILKP